MTSIFGRDEGTRRARGQRFRLSTLGEEEEARYQAVLEASREIGGRAAFDEGLTAWSAAGGLKSGDGLYLAELRGKALTLPELVEASGMTKSETNTALDRLIAAKLVEG